MSEGIFNSISAGHRETARSALAAVLGKAAIDAITPVTGGVSGASVFQVVAGDRRCLLRIEGPASPLRNPHQYTSMRIAAEAGIAPPICYLNDDAGVAVMEFIVERPLKSYTGGPPALALALGTMLQHLQSTPPFPAFIPFPEIVGRLWGHVCHTGLFAPGVLDAATHRLAQIREAYVWTADKFASSHNDLLPRNLLFDGARLWLIDWESAYRSDPLVDVATALDNFAPSPELEEILLRAWLGRAPDRCLRDRLVLVRTLTRLYYAGVLFSASAAAGPRMTPDSDLSPPKLDGFRLMLQDGRVAPDAVEVRHTLGKMYLASFMTGATAPGLPPPFSQFEVKREP